MYCQKRNGKYRFFESYIDPHTHEHKTASVTLDRNTVKSRAKAQELLFARISALKGQNDNSPVMTLKQLSEAHIAYQKAHVAPQTVIGDEKSAKAVLRILGENTKVSAIDAKYITRRLDATDESNTRKNSRLKYIRKLFRWAYRYNYIEDGSWVDHLGRYKDSAKKRRSAKYLEADELKVLLDAINIDKYKTLTAFLALSGLRIGEALALTWDDIDLDAKTIRVDKTLSLVTYEIGPTKTEESTRTVHIQDELAQIIAEMPENCFRSVQYPAYNKFLKETTERVLGRRLSTHSLRHTHVSLLAAQLVPYEVISHRVGHVDSKITKEIYTHVTQAMRDKDAEILDGIHLL